MNFKLAFMVFIFAHNLYSQINDSGKICIPPFIAGILPGSSSEREVMKLYGEGIFLDTIGTVGCRYYTNSDKTLTLEVSFSTMRTVDKCKLSKGFNPPHQVLKKYYPKLISHFLCLDGLLEYYIGKDQLEVIKWIGNPQSTYEKDSETVLVYESICHCELSSWIIFNIKHNKVVSITVSQDFG